MKQENLVNNYCDKDRESVINCVSDKMYNCIAEMRDTTEYVNKKADFADALGFVAGKAAYGYDVEKWTLIGRLLSEYQDVIDRFNEEANNARYIKIK